MKDKGAVNGTAPDEAEWGRIYKQLFVYAVKQHHLQVEDAKQVAQEAIRRFFDPKYANWDPDKYPTVPRFLGSVVNGIVSDMRKRERNAPEISKEGLPATGVRDHAPSAESRVIAASYGRRAVSKLLDAAKGNQAVEDVFLQMIGGKDSASEQAAALGLPIRSVYEARRRLDALKLKVKSEMEGER